MVGRPNSGKSTLINRLLGEERLLTGPEAGITRDAIAVDARRGRASTSASTTPPGMRRRSRIEEKLEKLSVADALNAVRFAEVVILLMDAQKPFEEQDLRIADLIEREGRALVIGMNKWDLIERAPGAIGKLREEVDHWLPQVKGVPIVPISGLHRRGTRPADASRHRRACGLEQAGGTSALNRWLGETFAPHPPPAVCGPAACGSTTSPSRRADHQASSCSASRADALPDAYRRYLVNSLRETFDLPGTPIRLALREKKNPYAKRGKR